MILLLKSFTATTFKCGWENLSKCISNYHNLLKKKKVGRGRRKEKYKIKKIQKWNVSVNWQEEEPTDIQEVDRKSYSQQNRISWCHPSILSAKESRQKLGHGIRKACVSAITAWCEVSSVTVERETLFWKIWGCWTALHRRREFIFSIHDDDGLWGTILTVVDEHQLWLDVIRCIDSFKDPHH